MNKFAASAALLLGASVLTSACARHDDTANVTTTNETVVTDESVDLNGASSDNLSADAPLGNTGADAGDGVGNAATPGNAP